MTDQRDNDNDHMAEWRQTTYHGVQMPGRTWLDARDRYDELSKRDLFARGRARLEARGEFDPARHGNVDDTPLSTREQLELLANGEVVARVYRHPYQVHHALEAGATWEQVAEATGTDEAKVRQEYREFAESQHRFWQHEGGRLGGLNDAEYQTAIARTAEPETSPDARVPLESEGLRQVQDYLTQADGPEPEAGR